MLELGYFKCGGVYRNWFLHVLEGSFALNVIMLAATTYYVKHSGENQLAVGYASVYIAFAIFIGILVLQLSSLTSFINYLKAMCVALGIRNKAEEEMAPPDISSLPDRLITPWVNQPHATRT